MPACKHKYSGLEQNCMRKLRRRIAKARNSDGMQRLLEASPMLRAVRAAKGRIPASRVAAVTVSE